MENEFGTVCPKAALAALLVIAAGPTVGQGRDTGAPGGLRWRLDSGQASFAGVEIERLSITRGAALELNIRGIATPGGPRLGSMTMTCPGRTVTSCRDGEIALEPAQGDSLSGQLDATRAGFEFRSGDAVVAFEQPGPGQGRLRAHDIPLDWVPGALLDRFGVVGLSGRLELEATLGNGGGRFEVGLAGAGFDTRDGTYAAAELSFEGNGEWRNEPFDATVALSWTGGEALLGPLYLYPPDAPLALELAVAPASGPGWQVDRARLGQGDWLDIRGTMRFDPTGRPWVPTARFEIAALDLQPAWRQGLQSLAASRGWGRLEPGGRITGALAIADDRLIGLRMVLDGGSVEDPDRRVSVSGLGADIEWRGGDGARDPGAVSLELGWDDAGLYRIPLGPGSLRLATTDDSTLALAEPFRLPILDGRLIVDRMVIDDWGSADREARIGARLEPMDLARLTRTLGWTEFGGTVSGRFPDIRYRGDTIEFRGGLEMELFGGRAAMDALSVERPFGTLPALAAQVEFEALDLELVTGAFEFGQMRGLASGYIRDLRLLDWQPVRFDAWFRTLDRSPKRRISQQAVDSLSTLGGGGGAALSGTLLRIFEDFPYRRVGIGCRLENNICTMRGLEDLESGGYVIVEGRALPRLDVVGFQRRVDWPRMMAQLAAVTGATGSGAP